MSELTDSDAHRLIVKSLHGEATTAEEDLLRAWRLTSSAREAEYQGIARLLELTTRVRALVNPGAPPRATEMIAQARADAARRPRRPWVWVAAATAAVVVAAVALRELGARRLGPLANPEVGVATDDFFVDLTPSTVSLKHGSVIRLAPGSRLQLIDPSRGREVFLRGRAYFAVARVERSPFRVRSVAGDVTVLGTRFDLDAAGDSLRVVVIEGHVVISAPGGRADVLAGEVGRVVRGTVLPVVKATAVEATVDWAGRFLAFQTTPLRKAALEIERQYGVRIEILDSTVAERTITGWFASWDLDDLIRVVCTIGEARCSRHNGVVRIERL